jgi:[protein-PII] uridylyltransferase
MTLAEERLLIATPDAAGVAAFSDRWRERLDEWLRGLFVKAAQSGPMTDLALIAVGGYGRGDLAPGSDLDLLLLHRGRTVPAAVADGLWYPIWDEGLKLGHAVRSPGEALSLASEDLDTATSLLSCRHLAGDASLTAELAEAALAQWRRKPRRMLGVLAESVVERQRRNGEVAYLLEPDLKEGRGGLRDVHAMRWVEAARPVLQPVEAEELAAAETTLFEARVALHLSTGRPADRLNLQDQDGAADLLGLSADDLMRDVSAAARRVAWISDDVWARVQATFSTGRSVLGWRSRAQAPGVVVRAGQVELEANVDPARRPDLLWVAADVACRTGARLGRPILTRLAERTPAPTEPWDDDLRARFLGLLGAGHAAVPVIEALDHVGLWTRYLPEWEGVRSRPQRNAYHRFTVDRHLLETVANASALTDRVERPDLLLLGALFHDIAKGRPGDHAVVGVDLADVAMERMGYPAEDRAIVGVMVLHHLLLPDAATRRDLSDPSTISTVAAAVGTRLQLSLLAALTEADSLATGPAAWGRWKADLVAELVHRVDHHLAGGDPGVLTLASFPDESHRRLAADGASVVSFDDDLVTVVTPDRPGLFAKVAGALALQGLSVLAADATSLDDMAVERFRVVAAKGMVPDRRRTVERIEAAIANRLAIDARLAERARTYRARPIQAGLPPAVVRFDDEASSTSTVLEVQAPDAPGLLYRMANTLAAFDLDVSIIKAQTIGGLVIDAFYLTHTDGSPVDPTLRPELELALRHAVS